ncbi:MAG: YadA-like family protein, partial [Acidaminococcaceae bacterium]|nr:YadA-like family protein [Acidaminococcaceae bacterium]
GIVIGDGNSADEKKVALTKDGLNNGGNRITNVAKGEAPTDAVNVDQLREVVNGVGNAVHDVDRRVSKVGAGAAALAALHPVDFDADNKLDIAAGWGHYKGQSSAALGAFYRPDERTMFSLGGTVGNGENMINAGITFKLDGRRDGMYAIYSKARLVKEIEQLKSDNAKLHEQVQTMQALVEKLLEKNK